VFVAFVVAIAFDVYVSALRSCYGTSSFFYVLRYLRLVASFLDDAFLCCCSRTTFIFLFLIVL
jgi:hypothetical protein